MSFCEAEAVTDAKVIVSSCSAVLDYDYVFSENGLVAHKEGKLIGNQVLFLYLIQLSNLISELTSVLEVVQRCNRLWLRIAELEVSSW